ncbi:DUF1570 domain-containing protein [Aurantiacibacter poecillastricola]|uniref:DUF1570 domain-containing protein n=1 Tax=Aurantiacibacter poecillastricola TaxID=3064385 RepID=UPI00273E5751|nr:DUF1570 domain-containing protein [Aurantiacibacter sp. 219JJ12-13]MDP5260188.1 DUF1570 domain-containing protein [Aurantiacibacter sp. 219JJ12-13]
MIRLIIAALVIALAATPAQARWRMATSENFVIYANDSAEDLQRFGYLLEQFHSSLELLTNTQSPAPSPSNRVTVYVVGSQYAVRRLADAGNSVGGFYLPRAAGSSAFVQNLRFSSRETDFSTIVLLHEYAHHFIISNQRFAMPRWLSEGAAEFFASARFPADGGVEIGRPAQHRAYDLFAADEVSIEELLDDRLYAERTSRRYDAFYGRAWLLYHYLAIGTRQMETQRAGQLGEYTRLIASGTPAMDAARQVFGDLDRLDDELDDYLDERRMNMIVLQPEMVPAAPVHVHELSDGMDEVLPLKIRSRRGVNREEALELVPEIRQVAEEYPSDPGVLSALAEAEYDAGNDDAAIAAADRAIALDPLTVNAYVQKGYALFRKAKEADDRNAAYEAAMAPFSALNRMENDHPVPLIHYYHSFGFRGEPATDLAREALEQASALAPFDRGLAMNVAMMRASTGEIEGARRLLRTLASHPHGGDLAEQADGFLKELDNAVEGDPVFLGMATVPVELDVEDPEDAK